jgi:response regulator NasT
MCKILVVEDDRLVLATLVQGLAAHGFEVVQASSGQEALAKAQEFKPELALVDVRLPDLSGPEVAKNLDREYGTAVLFLSAYDDQEAISQAIEAGGLGYLVKPLTVAQLLPALKAVLAVGRRLKRMHEEKTQLQTVLESNRIINQAVGILMERLHLPRGQAYEILRQRARSRQRRVLELAQQVVEIVDGLNQLRSETN